METPFAHVLVTLLFARSTVCFDFVSEDRFRELEKLVKFQQKKINDLEAKNELLMEMLLKLESGAKYLHKEREKEDELNADDERDSLKTNDGNFQAITRRNALLTRTVGQVAFNAFEVGNSAVCDVVHKAVVFGVETVDIGSGYEPSNGIYVPPVSGVYVFVWTAVAAENEYFTAELVVNGNVKGRTITDATPQRASGSYTTHPATGVAVLQLNAGDHVFIRRGVAYGCSIAPSTDALNTFSGWLLF